MEPKQTPPRDQDPEVWQKDTPDEQAAAEQTFHVARPVNPAAPTIPGEIQQLHDESCHKYPSLNLSPGEFVIKSVPRHIFGLIRIWGIVAVLVVSIFAVSILLTSSAAGLAESLDGSTKAGVYFGAFLLAILIALGGFIATYIYENNRFFLTNESVIQEIQITLFAKREQTVSLSNIEDASFQQSGILETLFNYGSIRLSTEGDETTYRFTFVSNPKKHIATLNNAVEAFKMGRPVTSREDD